MKLFFKILLKAQKLAESILYLSLVVSLTALVIYFFDFDFTDTILLFLLVILRYSSFILCICSFYKLLVNIFHFIRRPSFPRAMKNFLYLFFIIYGILMVILESFIVVIAGGT